MPSLTSLLAAGTLSSLALAMPLARSAAPVKGFSVAQSVPVPPKSGPAYLRDAYRKYNKPVPAHVEAAAEAGQGSVTATPEQYDTEYLCPVTIGGQTLNLDFDTGSADLWVFSSELSSSEQSGHEIYNPSQSSTAQQVSGATWNISYGDGSGASGNVYTDDVTIGGVTVTGQDVELAQQVSSQFVQDTQNDGLVGLAFSSINTVTPNQATTFFDTAQNEGVLSQNVFTADLKKGAPGTYNFGYIDNSAYTGSITYTPVDNSQGFWGFTADGYSVGGNAQSESIQGIADTGTTLLLLPDDVVSNYYGQVSGAQNDSSQGGYVFDCGASLPDLAISIGGTDFTVPGSYINLSPTGSGNSKFTSLYPNISPKTVSNLPFL